jgi:hypothetical protein
MWGTKGSQIEIIRPEEADKETNDRIQHEVGAKNKSVPRGPLSNGPKQEKTREI